MANELHERIRGYLSGRSPRERAFLLAGGLALVVLLAYGLLYEPQNEARAKLAERLPAERAELRLMRVQAAEIQRLRTRMGDTDKGGLEQRVKASAAALGLGRKFHPVRHRGERSDPDQHPAAADRRLDRLAGRARTAGGDGGALPHHRR
jgi:type II secretory pathway component PulM